MRFQETSSLLQLEKALSYSILPLETPEMLVMVRCEEPAAHRNYSLYADLTLVTVIGLAQPTIARLV